MNRIIVGCIALLLLEGCASRSPKQEEKDAGVAAESVMVGARTPAAQGVLGGMVAAKSAAHLDALSMESYAAINENRFVLASEDSKSTFSIDVDRASYSNVRRFITSSQLPPVDAVRIEELINYFRYDDPEPRRGEPFSVTTEVAECPWNRGHRLLRVGIRGQKIADWEMKPNNLVFLIDVSGSMASADKLPLVKSAFRMLVDQLRGQDTVSIVVYAGAAGLVLPPTPGSHKDIILDAIERLDAGGSTAGGEGILLAYKTARESFLREGNNRVILATDGDFNVGVSSEAELQTLIEEQRGHGIFLTVLGFGTGNLQDSKMELLADKGNGNYAYVDSQLEAKKVFIEELGGTLVTIAKDVKVQIDFDPIRVESYRLIGYENRLLAAEDFDDDTKDAGELGAGHFVTALYEIVPTGRVGALGTLSLRYKEPDGAESRLMRTNIIDAGSGFETASADLRFAAAVAEYGMILRNSEHKGSATLDQAIAIARSSQGPDLEGYRRDFIELAESTRDLMRTVSTSSY